MARSVDEYTVDEFVRLFEESETATHEARTESERCRDYYDGKQWSAQEASVLRARKQPVITINRIKPKVDALLGMEQQTRTDPKALPRTPVHEEDAESATDAIRAVCDLNDFDGIRSEVFEDLAVEGTGGVEVYVQTVGSDPRIRIRQYKFDRIFYDPHSRARDFADAKYLGGVLWMDAQDAKAKWPDAAAHIDTLMADTSAQSDTYDDVPRQRWTDPKRRRVRACLIYCRKPEGWVFAWYTKGAFLEGPATSPYLDEDGEPECPLIFQSAHVNRDGERYGHVKQLLDIQDEINKRRSKGLHLINQRQTFGNQQSGLDAAEVKRELAKPDGHVNLKSGRFGEDFGVIPTADMARGNFELLAEAKGEIDAVGSNAAMQGKEERSMSGRALMAREQSGQLEITPLMEALRHWQNRVYRAVWNRVRQFWTEERWVRVTDDERNMRWVQLNAPMTVGEYLQSQGQEIPDTQDPRLQQPALDKQGQPLRRNNVAALDVDIVIEDVPDVANIQQEVFGMFTDAVRASGQPVPLDIWIEMMPGFPRKREVLERLKGDEQQQQQMAQLEQIAQQLQMALQQAEVVSKQADAEAKAAQAEKSRAAAIRDQVEAEAKAAETPANIEKIRAEAINELQNAEFRPLEFEQAERAQLMRNQPNQQTS